MKIKREVTFLPLDATLIYALTVVGAVIASLIVIFAIRRRGEQGETVSGEEKSKTGSSGLPFKIVRTVPRKEVGDAKDELRLLDLEREVLSNAIRRLYEAQAEGKITEEERERIADKYKSRIRSVKEAITKDESLVALHELETMQEDLIKLFSERFDDLSGKIDELRSRVKVKPIKEIAVTTAKGTKERKKPKKTRKRRTKKRKKKKKKPKPSPKTEAEERIDKIREEVEKVLDKLGQMEIET